MLCISVGSVTVPPLSMSSIFFQGILGRLTYGNVLTLTRDLWEATGVLSGPSRWMQSKSNLKDRAEEWDGRRRRDVGLCWELRCFEWVVNVVAEREVMLTKVRKPGKESSKRLAGLPGTKFIEWKLSEFIPPPLLLGVTTRSSIPCLLLRTTSRNAGACSPQSSRPQKPSAWSIACSKSTSSWPSSPYPGELSLIRRRRACAYFAKVGMTVQRESCLQGWFFFIFCVQLFNSRVINQYWWKRPFTINLFGFLQWANV